MGNFQIYFDIKSDCIGCVKKSQWRILDLKIEI